MQHLVKESLTISSTLKNNNMETNMFNSLNNFLSTCFFQVADIHMSPYTGKEVSSASSISKQGRLKVERLEKELSALTTSAMSYKSIYAKSASQLASEAMAACETEASSKKVRKTVIETSRKQVAAA